MKEQHNDLLPISEPGEFVSRDGNKVVIARRHHLNKSIWTGTYYTSQGNQVVSCWNNDGSTYGVEVEHPWDVVGLWNTRDEPRATEDLPTSNPGLHTQVSERHRECAKEIYTTIDNPCLPQSWHAQQAFMEEKCASISDILAKHFPDQSAEIEAFVEHVGAPNFAEARDVILKSLFESETRSPKYRQILRKPLGHQRLGKH